MYGRLLHRSERTRLRLPRTVGDCGASAGALPGSCGVVVSVSRPDRAIVPFGATRNKERRGSIRRLGSEQPGNEDALEIGIGNVGWVEFNRLRDPRQVIAEAPIQTADILYRMTLRDVMEKNQDLFERAGRKLNDATRG